MSDQKANPAIANQSVESTGTIQKKTSCKIREWFAQYDDHLFFIIMVILAFWIRWVFIPFQSGDYIINFAKWYDALKIGGFAAFKTDFFDYTPPYLYLIWLFSHLPLNSRLFFWRPCWYSCC